jgi:pimeloyl-ACP methyl ester carboxylesterase
MIWAEMMNEGRPRRLRRALLWGAPALLVVWLVASGIAARDLSGRAKAIHAEPVSKVQVPGLEERRLKTDDGLDIGAWLLRPRGARPIVLLLHGNGASRSSFSGLLPFLARENCGAMAISMRAHGDSAGEVNDFGYSARQDVLAAIGFLEREFPGRKIVIVGESLGASAALFAAKACAGRVQGYLFAAPYGDLETAVWNRCDSRLFTPFSQAAYAGLLLWAPAFLPVSTREIRPGDHFVDIPETTSVVVFASENDRYARLEDILVMTGRIRSHAAVVVVQGGDHAHFLSQHEVEYRQAILDLVSRVEQVR